MGYINRNGREGKVGGKVHWVKLSKYLIVEEQEGTGVEESASLFCSR